MLVGAHAMFGKPACPYGQMCREADFSDDVRLRPGVMIDAPKLTKWLGLYAEYARRTSAFLPWPPRRARK